MSLWQDLKNAVSAVITTNANNEISGLDLRELLNTMIIPSLGSLQYKGVAQPYVDAGNIGTDPGTPGGAVFYLASKTGDYPYFGDFTLVGGLVAFVYNHTTGTWTMEEILTVEQSGGVSQEYVDQADADLRALINGSGSGTGNFINHFTAGYDSGLTYKPYADWNFGATNFKTTGNIVLNAADATNARFDLIVLNDNGTITKITGTPAANPVEPDYNQQTQLKAALILIEAGATAPSGIIQHDIYTENLGVAGGEWNGAVLTGGARWNLAATEPHTGTYAIKGTALVNQDKISLTPGVRIPAAEIREISFKVKNLTANTADGFAFWYTAGFQSRRQVYDNDRVLNLKFAGYSGANVTDWQSITVAMPDDFIDIASIAFACSGDALPTILIDEVKYNNGSVEPPTNGEGYATLAYVDKGDADTLQAAKDYADSLSAAPITYVDMAALYAGQANQKLGIIYRVENASAHPQVTAGRAWFQYKGTTAGNDTDYILQSEEESMNLDAQFASIEARLTALEAEGTAITVGTSRALQASDNKKLLLITAPITLTWPAGGIVGFKVNFDVDAAGQLTVTDSAGTPGDDLDAANGTILEAGKMAHAYRRPDNGKLRLKGDFIV